MCLQILINPWPLRKVGGRQHCAPPAVEYLLVLRRLFFEFDDALGLYNNTDRLEARLSSIVRHTPEDWLRSLPRMFSPEWKEALATLRNELKRTPTVGETFAFLWETQQRMKRKA